MLRRRKKIIAVLLLLVFSQKAGLRLWMHNWLHAGKIASSCGGAASEKIQLACDCFNEAMLPLEETAVFTVSAPIQKSTELGYPPPSLVPDTEKVFCSLKGPPALPSF